MKPSIYQKMLDRGLNHIVGGGDPWEVARQNFTALHYLTQLQPTMRILDFGCGCGRVAVPLLDFLSPEGRYVGVDIIPAMVEFCHREIASEYDNASFYLSPDHNGMYDKFKQADGSELPRLAKLAELGEASFDVIIAFSVFTHLTHKDASRYLALLAKLLKPGGKLFASCFLINESSRELLREGKSTTPFGTDVTEDKQTYYADCQEPLTCVGFPERELEAMGHACGLEPFVTYYGHWCGRAPRHSFQDIMVFENEVSLPKDFDAQAYLKLNPDLPWSANASGRIHAERHYLEHGYRENRAWK